MHRLFCQFFICFGHIANHFFFICRVNRYNLFFSCNPFAANNERVFLAKICFHLFKRFQHFVFIFFYSKVCKWFVFVWYYHEKNLLKNFIDFVYALINMQLTCQSTLTEFFFYNGISYSFILLYKLTRDIPSNFAAALLLPYVLPSVSIILSFSIAARSWCSRPVRAVSFTCLKSIGNTSLTSSGLIVSFSLNNIILSTILRSSRTLPGHS